MNKITLSLLLLVFANSIFAQQIRTNGELEGHWKGNFIRNGNSTQAFTVDFVRDGDSLRAELRNLDWAYYGLSTSPVTVNGRVVEFGSMYGKITVVKDSVYGEMVGESRFAQVHMKKGLRPPRRKIEQMEVSFDLGDIRVRGQVTRPAGPGPWPTAILVHGRGCLDFDWWDGRPELLAQYGMAVVTYDNRGSERTGFPCEKTTMDIRSADLVRITSQVADMPETGPVGYITNSAGGWVGPKAAAEGKNKVAFIVSGVGPSTSVKQQQIDCSIYTLREEFGLGDREVKEAVRYVELSFTYGSDKKVYREMMALLDSAEVHGWRDVLDDDDVPASVEELGNIWVRRNDYDPSKDLQSFQGPFLSLLGGNDYIVPYRENAARFRELFDAVGKKNYRVVVVAGAGHGLEHGHASRDLGFEPELGKWYTYWKFDRVAPGTMDEIVAFLQEYGFID